VKLLAKFTVVFILVFGIGLYLAGRASRDFLQTNAEDQVLQQARLMMENMVSARTYTTKQIKPLLIQVQNQNKTFLPQTVPAYAATESFNYMHGSYPDYAYKEATLNPTNLRDRAVDWETDVINVFRNDKKKQELFGKRDTPTGPSMYLARPIAAGAPCLECHDQPKGAPVAMIRAYGTANGFGWKNGETVGAQIVSVPMTVPIQMAEAGFRNLMTSLSVIFLATLVLLDVLLYFTVVRPVVRLSKMADQISLGNFDTPELPASGSDEIATLGGSFNRMRRSLEKAINMLGT
jgi:HAMP domain-containing protein